MPTKAHIKSRQALGYLMQHLEDAPGYKVWHETHGGWYESNHEFLQEVKNWLDLTPQEMWLSQLSVHTFIEAHILSLVAEDTTEVTRVEVIDQDGRQYTNYKCNKVRISMQDDNRTMKIFLNTNQNDNETLKSK